MHLEVGSWWRLRGTPKLITAINTLTTCGIAPDDWGDFRWQFSNVDRVSPVEEDKSIKAGNIYQHDIQTIELEDLLGHISYITVYERLRRIGNGPKRPNRTDSPAPSPTTEGAGEGIESWARDWQQVAG